MTRLRAATLIETLVVAGLLSVIMAVMVTVYLLGNRYLVKTQTQSKLHQQASQGLYQVIRDLSASCDDAAVLVALPGSHCWFLGGGDPQGQYHFSPLTGQQIWHHWVCYYKDDAVLRRSTVDLTSSDNFSPWTGLAPTPTLALFRGPSAQSNKMVSESVGDFQVVRVTRGLYQVSLMCQMQTTTGQMSDVRLSQQVYLHN